MPLIPIVAGLILTCVVIYKYIVTPLFLSPLARLPSIHWSAPLTRLWILNERFHYRETFAVHEAHEKLGSVVRLAPNEISVNSFDGGIKTIYTGGYEKGHDWYSSIFSNYGIEPMFAMGERDRHGHRKRMISNVYAKSTLHSSPAMAGIMQTVVGERMVGRIQRERQQSGGIEFYHIFAATVMDAIAAYAFGVKHSCNFIDNTEKSTEFLRIFKARQRYQFWMQDLPGLVKILRQVGLCSFILPDWIGQANDDIEAWILSMQDEAEKAIAAGVSLEPEDWPTVYAQLRKAMLQDLTKDTANPPQVADLRLEFASEMLDHILAGYDTSSIALTFLAWELSRPQNSEWQERLYAELRDVPSLLDARALDALPVLQAILMETLRLHAPIPGNQPRVTPPNAILSAGDRATDTEKLLHLPAGVRVQAQAWSLHRIEKVFPNANSWKPERWLETQDPELMREMNRHFWAFGSGGRMCVGSNFAMQDMKTIIAGIWGKFKTTVRFDDGMKHNGAYVAEPIGKDGKWCLLDVEDR